MGGFYKFSRILIGAFLIFAGLNKFFNFIQMMELPAEAAAFMGAMGETGYFISFLGIFEVVCGAMFLFRRSTPLGALMLFPWSVNVMLFHFFLAPAQVLPALVVVAGNVYFLIKNMPLYRPVFDSLTKGLRVGQFKMQRHQRHA